MSARIAGTALCGLLLWATPSAAQAPEGPAATTSTTVAAPAAAPMSEAQRRLAKENAEVIRLAEQETGHIVPPDRGPDSGRPASLWGSLLQMVVVLGGVSLLAYLVLGKLLPKLMRVPSPTGRPRMMRIVDRMPIDQRRSILVVSIGEQYFMVGNSEGGLNLISQLDAETVMHAQANIDPGPSGLSRLKDALTGQGSKES